jgi:hypothetical protein
VSSAIIPADMIIGPAFYATVSLRRGQPNVIIEPQKVKEAVPEVAAAALGSKKVDLSLIACSSALPQPNAQASELSLLLEGNRVLVVALSRAGEPADASEVRVVTSTGQTLEPFEATPSRLVLLLAEGEAVVEATVLAPGGARVHLRGSPLSILHARPPPPHEEPSLADDEEEEVVEEAPAPAAEPVVIVEEEAPEVVPLILSVLVHLDKEGPLDAEETLALRSLLRRSSSPDHAPSPPLPS